jgi:hypothetical protein
VQCAGISRLFECPPAPTLGTKAAKTRAVLDSDPSMHNYSRASESPIQKAFDIRARSRLELELRLDRFGDALVVRGGRLLTVSRGRATSGGYFAAVRYSLPPPRP